MSKTKKKKSTHIILNLEKMDESRLNLSPMPQLQIERLTIGRVKINDHNCLDVSFSEMIDDGTVNEIVKRGGGIVHPDMRVAMESLAPHVAFLCDQNDAPSNRTFDPVEKNYSDDFKHYIINGIAIKGTAGDEGVVISATKLTNGKQLNLQTPEYLLGGTDYKFINELSECVERIKYEARQYLGGKYLAKQLDIGFDETSEETKTEAASTEQPAAAASNE